MLMRPTQRFNESLQFLSPPPPLCDKPSCYDIMIAIWSRCSDLTSTSKCHKISFSTNNNLTPVNLLTKKWLICPPNWTTFLPFSHFLCILDHGPFLISTLAERSIFQSSIYEVIRNLAQDANDQNTCQEEESMLMHVWYIMYTL